VGLEEAGKRLAKLRLVVQHSDKRPGFIHVTANVTE
jgi:hypothetical protein